MQGLAADVLCREKVERVHVDPVCLARREAAAEHEDVKWRPSDLHFTASLSLPVCLPRETEP